MKNTRGWHREPARHALAAKGIKTTAHKKSRYIVGHPDRQPEHVDRETEDILKIERELRLAELTDEENKAWVAAFSHYVDDEGMSDEEADQHAWADLQKEFPRLKRFDGCMP